MSTRARLDEKRLTSRFSTQVHDRDDDPYYPWSPAQHRRWRATVTPDELRLVLTLRCLEAAERTAVFALARRLRLEKGGA